MIAIYELREQDNVCETNKTDAEIVTKLIENDRDYLKINLGSGWGGSVIDCKNIGIFTDNESNVFISVGYDREKQRPARIQFMGLEKEILSVKNVLIKKLNKKGYRLS